mmetsp:Transcript_27928/g.94009  ORF Transcript_27928/g.94009 Transcript_27928/m.94009 type:complete len:206 (-) Transcript_27928:947-1564(-)
MCLTPTQPGGGSGKACAAASQSQTLRFGESWFAPRSMIVNCRWNSQSTLSSKEYSTLAVRALQPVCTKSSSGSRDRSATVIRRSNLNALPPSRSSKGRSTYFCTTCGTRLSASFNICGKDRVTMAPKDRAMFAGLTIHVFSLPPICRRRKSATKSAKSVSRAYVRGKNGDSPTISERMRPRPSFVTKRSSNGNWFRKRRRSPKNV